MTPPPPPSQAPPSHARENFLMSFEPSGVNADPDSDGEPENFQFKVILLGDGTVGKTSIAMRFTEDNFSTGYKQTIGLDFFIKRIILPGFKALY